APFACAHRQYRDSTCQQRWRMGRGTLRPARAETVGYCRAGGGNRARQQLRRDSTPRMEGQILRHHFGLVWVALLYDYWISYVSRRHWPGHPDAPADLDIARLL